MSRQPQYKCWIKKHEKFAVQLCSIHFDIETVYCRVWDTKEWDPSEFSFDEVEFVRYTWLKDKNSKEIYEWDIVQVFGKTAVIEYCSEKRGGYIFRCEEMWDMSDCPMSNGEDLSPCEIIWNIIETRVAMKTQTS